MRIALDDSIKSSLFMGLCLLAAGAAAQVPCSDAPAGIISWWAADGNAQDIVDANEGTLRNGMGFAAGKVGQAFDFDGFDDDVQVADADSLDLNLDWTIEMWVNPSTVSTQQGIIDKWVGAGNQRSYVLDIRAGGGLEFDTTTDGTTGAGDFLFSTGTLAPGVWSHVAITLDAGGKKSFFINGVLDPSSSTVSGVFGSTVDLFFSGTFDPFDGRMDEITFYDRALVASEIQAIFNAGSAGKCKDRDDDGVLDDLDLCADTTIPEATVPSRRLGRNRWALVDDDGLFDTTPPKGKGPQRSYTIDDTGGCSCEQIIDYLDLGKGHEKFGCSISAMDAFVALANP